jgi:hypothetical protein
VEILSIDRLDIYRSYDFSKAVSSSMCVDDWFPMGEKKVISERPLESGVLLLLLSYSFSAGGSMKKNEGRKLVVIHTLKNEGGEERPADDDKCERNQPCVARCVPITRPLREMSFQESRAEVGRKFST